MMEVGLGIHGEPGARVAPIVTCDEIVEELLKVITSTEEGRNYLPLARGQTVALMVNNLGSTTPLELASATRHAIKHLAAAYGVTVVRCYVGSFMTSLDMTGFSLTLLKLDGALLPLLDAPAAPVAWPACPPLTTETTVAPKPLPAGCDANAMPAAADAVPLLAAEQVAAVGSSIAAAARAIIGLENHLTEWDTKVGDGDCGTTLRAGAEAVLADCGAYPLSDPVLAIKSLGCSLARTMGGTSGILYTIFLSAAAADLTAAKLTAAPTAAALASALAAGVAAISHYGGASEGDCTMLDALHPAAQAMVKAGPAQAPATP